MINVREREFLFPLCYLLFISCSCDQFNQVTYIELSNFISLVFKLKNILPNCSCFFNVLNKSNTMYSNWKHWFILSYEGWGGNFWFKTKEKLTCCSIKKFQTWKSQIRMKASLLQHSMVLKEYYRMVNFASFLWTDKNW